MGRFSNVILSVSEESQTVTKTLHFVQGDKQL